MLDIQIMGLPKNLKKQRLIHLLKNVIFGKKLKSKFWISNIHSSPNSNYIQVSMTISKNADAYIAIELINNFCYFNGNEDFQLSAVIVENVYDEPIDNEILKEQVKRDRAARGSKKSSWSASGNGRSRSPLYEDESIKLEMEIDLVRRQRLLVEEERKLLLEKKKLELLQEFEPSSVQQLEKYAAAIEKHTLEDIDPPKPQKVVSKSSTPSTGIPLFVLPCRRIMKEMRNVLSKITDETIKDSLLQILRLKVRKRITELLRGHGFMHSGEIHKLYRQTYPVDTDKTLLEQIKAEFNDTQNEVDKEKASIIKQIVANKEADIEAKILTDQPISGNIKIIEVKTELTTEENSKNCADESMKNEDLNAVSAGQDGKINTDEQIEANDTEHIINDIDNELDDWLEDDVNNDDGVQNDNEPPKDSVTITEDV